MFLNVSTFSLRLLAIDSSVSPERKVYGRVPEPPPCFAAFIVIPLDPVLALVFLFSLTNVPRFCPILFPTSVEEFLHPQTIRIRSRSSASSHKTRHDSDDRNEQKLSLSLSLSLSLFSTSLERKTKGGKVRKMKFDLRNTVVGCSFTWKKLKEEKKKEQKKNF